MSAAGVPRKATVGLGRRLVLGIATALLLAVFAANGWSFAWPSAAARGEYAIGPSANFAPGSVATFLFVDGELRELPVGREYGRRPLGYPAVGTDLVHIARFPDGQFKVFTGAAPFLDSTIVWYQSDRWGGSRGEWVGLFAEGRRGSRWAIDGTRVFGPAPRGLDTYSFRMRADGVLVIDLADLTEGAGGAGLPPPYDFTSDAWPTSGWPSR